MYWSPTTRCQSIVDAVVGFTLKDLRYSDSKVRSMTSHISNSEDLHKQTVMQSGRSYSQEDLTYLSSFSRLQKYEESRHADDEQEGDGNDRKVEPEYVA